jgi:hypothetical protein
MKFQNRFGKAALLACGLMLLSFVAGRAQAQDTYSFKVTNKTKSTIKRLLASEDGKKYGYFDIGNGIAPGQTVKIVWDKSTNGESCRQYFKAVFANGEESEAVKFDFCEEDLELVFS